MFVAIFCIVVLLFIMSWGNNGAPSFIWGGWKNELLGSAILLGIVFGLLYLDDLFRFLVGK